MTEENNTQRWVKDAKAGDGAAWSFLYKYYHPKLFSTALRICGNTPGARDAVQNALITAYLKLGDLKDNSAFGSWIKRILIHSCYRALKNSTGGNSKPLEEGFVEDETNRKFDWLYSQARLHSILSKLPEVLHSTIVLRYFSDFQSYDEIANILSVPVGTVRSRLNQAREKLSDLWKDDEHINGDIFRQNGEWNQFYSSTFSALHEHDDYKNRFLNHLQKDIEIIFGKDRRNSGSWLIDKEIHEDRKFGSSFTPVNIFSSGAISIVEVKHFNAPEHPDHCPENSVFVFYRKKDKAVRMNFYHCP